MKRHVPLRRKTPMRRMSLKRQRESIKYRALRLYHLLTHPVCEFEGCRSTAMELHHKALRGRNYLNAESFQALCRVHHSWIHQHPNQAREKGYLVTA